MAKTFRKLDYCPNCEAPLTRDNNYCSGCGQQNTTKSVSMGLLVRDFLDDYFTLDSRFLVSMKPFLFKPGFLTNEFNTGRRLKFMPPLRMYIVFSLLYFIIPRVPEPIPQGEDLTETSPALSDTLDVEQDSLDTSAESGTVHFRWGTDSLGNKRLTLATDILDEERVGDPRYRDSVVNAILDSWEYKEGSFRREISEKLGRNLLSMMAYDGNDFLGRLSENIPTMMFFLLPLFAFLIKLFYFRQKPLYVETIIFSLHFHSFLFLVFSISEILRFSGISNELFEAILLLLICVYLVLALRRVFNQNYWKTIMKFFGLTLTYSILVGVSYVLTFVFTLYTY